MPMRSATIPTDHSTVPAIKDLTATADTALVTTTSYYHGHCHYHYISIALS